MDPRLIARLRATMGGEAGALDPVSMRAELAPGDVIDDRFVVQARLGAGAMGTVYRVLDRKSGSACALKLAARDAYFDEARFVREAELLSEVEHPAVVRYLAHGEARGAHYLVMELLEGQSLAARLRDGPLSIEDTLELAARVAGGLGAAHRRGLVHRDLTPNNVVLCGGGAAGAKVCDFGLARRLRDPGTLTRAGSLMGTPGYIAPEQALLGRQVDARCDLFALGCLLFECATGRPAFVGADALAVLTKIVLGVAPGAAGALPAAAAGLGGALAAMMAKDPDARPADAEAALESIRLAAARSGDAAPVRSRASTVSVVVAKSRRSNTPAAGELLDEARRTGDAVRVMLRGTSAICEVLVDGAVVLAFEDPAPEQPAACALALRAERADVPIALASARAQADPRAAWGEAIDRAARMLQSGPPASKPRGVDSSWPVRIDAQTRTMLPSGFRVVDDPTGPLLFAQ